MRPSMRNMSLNLRRTVLTLACATPLLMPVLSGCDDPKQDDFQNQGGIAGNPEGVIRGSVVYLGPRPKCQYVDDKPTRVRGRVILTLFEYDNPPPPAGRATKAANLLAISGSKLFTLDDCLPEGDRTDPSEVVTRSVPFDWPTIELGEKDGIDYQVRGFYDYDEDMIPFFSVKRLPTAGDVVGAALNDVTNPAKGLMRISFPAADDAKNGFVRTGVTVALRNYVWTELPAFELDPAHRALSAEAFIEPAIDVVARAADVPATVRGIWNLSCSLPGKPETCGPSIRLLKEGVVADTLAEAGVQLSFDPKRYGFFLEPVDLRTVNMGTSMAPVADVPVPDGIADPHPLLGSSLRVPWTTPIVLFLRNAESPAAAKIEALAGIPSVTLVGSPLPDETVAQRTFVSSLNIAVPPLAVVDLKPGTAACRVPYAAPGNTTPTFEDRVAQCSDLPTGVFAVNVLHGVAGGTRVTEPDPNISENGVLIQGGGLSGQAWSIPNELSQEEQVGEDYVLESQGPGGMFIIHDPRPDTTGDCKQARDPNEPFGSPNRDIKYRGLCKAGDPPIVENPVGVDNVACLLTECCDGVRHLCDVKLCEMAKVSGLNVRKSPSRIVRTDKKTGLGIPDCIPYAMPELCCE